MKYVSKRQYLTHKNLFVFRNYYWYFTTLLYATSATNQLIV